MRRKNFPYFINKLGLELEGAFESGRTPKGGDYHGDGSVYFDELNGCSDCDCCDSAYYSGEFVSPPLSSWTKVEQWVRENAPDEVNHTCGTHFHMSMRNLIYLSAFAEASPKIVRAIPKTLKTWASLVKLPRGDRNILYGRLDGSNEYCRATSNYDIIEGLSEGLQRYFFLNFTSLYKYGTIECRVLPAFKNPGLILSSVSALLSMFDKYIRKELKKSSVLVESSVEEPRTARLGKLRWSVEENKIRLDRKESLYPVEDFLDTTAKIAPIGNQSFIYDARPLSAVLVSQGKFGKEAVQGEKRRSMMREVETIKRNTGGILRETFW